MEVVVDFLRSPDGLILAAIVGSLVVIKLLKLSSVIAVAAAGLPWAVYFIDAPLISHLRAEYPTFAVCGTWLSTAVLGLLWRGLSPLCTGFAGSVGVLRLIYLAGLAAALTVVGILCIAPEVLAQHVPAWRSTVGGVLLVVTLVGVSRALAQIVKAGALLAVWSGVAVVLASQVFLHKMPNAIEPADVSKLEEVFASVTARRALHAIYEVSQGRYSFSRILGSLIPVSSDVRGVGTTESGESFLHMTDFGLSREADRVTERIGSSGVQEAT